MTKVFVIGAVILLAAALSLGAVWYFARRFWAAQPRRHWKSRKRWHSEPQPDPKTKHLRDLMGGDDPGRWPDQG